MQTLKKIYNYAQESLKNSGIEDFKTDAFLLMEHHFNISKLDFILNPEKPVSDEDYREFLSSLEKRKNRVPLQYILGSWNFMGINLKVGEGVLIPREDTSVLVDAVINKIHGLNNPKIIDLCSGSGCVAIALNKYLKTNPKIYAVELSKDAFKYLKENSKDCKSVSPINDDIFRCYKDFDDDYFDVIVSNPPYIKKSEIGKLQPEVLNEPIAALDGGEDGLYFYENICKYWSAKLKTSGIIAFEIGFDEAEVVTKIMENNEFKNIRLIKDINNLPRVLLGEKA